MSASNSLSLSTLRTFHGTPPPPASNHAAAEQEQEHASDLGDSKEEITETPLFNLKDFRKPAGRSESGTQRIGAPRSRTSTVAQRTTPMRDRNGQDKNGNVFARGSSKFAAAAREGLSRPSQSAIAKRDPPKEKSKKEDWQVQREALKAKFPEGWNPRKKLSPDAMAGIRAIHEQFPDVYTTPVLAAKFEVSPEAIRRILRSKWKPSAEEEEDRQRRWHGRGMKVWERWAAMGKKPPQRWREDGIEWDKPYRGTRDRTPRSERERQEATGASVQKLASDLV